MITTFVRSRPFLLAILALQFLLVNIVSAPLFGDAARNLHWGLLTAEDPGFLLGGLDTYERIKGFQPDPSTLASMQLYQNPQGSLHRWWGPLAPMLFAAIWRLTSSYTILQLAMPLAGAATVLLLYLLARDMLGARRALLAAAFLSCFPIFREYASTSYTEVLSALVVTAALLCYRRGQFWGTLLLGTLTILTKMDLFPLYAGALGASMVLPAVSRHGQEPVGQEPQARAPGQYSVLARLMLLVGPVILAAPWIWIHYLASGSGGPTRGLSGGLFVILAPQLLELLFYIPWYGALITLAAIGAAVWAGMRAQRQGRADVGMLVGWLGVGIVVLLIYAATPGAGNSPRVLIPALPALAILFAAGFDALPGAWRRRIGFYLAVIFLLINVITAVYDGASGSVNRSYMPAWEALRSRPAGFVLTEKYWETILFTRQRATWFEADKQFETNIMQSREHFARYVTQHPIRYVLLPVDGTLASPEVRAYLDSTATKTPAGQMVLYELP